MKRKSLLSLMLLCFAFFGVARADVVEIGDGGTTNNSYLPGYNYYNYSLSQQIYSACEIGTAGTINSIAFKNTGAEKTRTYNVYMLLTEKETFTSGTDWVAMSADNLVFSGEVTFTVGEWTTITLATPFALDGSNNLLVGVADVTGSYSNSPHMACLVFNATSQAIRAYRDDSAYDIAAPGVSGTVVNVKNQIQLNITPDPSVAMCCPVNNLKANNIETTSALLSWNSNASQFEVEYKKASDETWTPATANGTQALLQGLDASTMYVARVRVNCGEGEYSEWEEVSFQTKQGAVAVGQGWSDDFEGNVNWIMVNGGNNAWVIGTAVNNGGDKAMYVSNDGGTSNAYTTSGVNMVYATKLMTFETGQYIFTYDWQANGEGSYDYIRAWLAPSTFAFTANQLPDGSTSTYQYQSTTPQGWMALDGGSKLNGVTEWQSKSATVDVTAGDYYVVFMWGNDGSGGTNPPAAIDNFEITKVACAAPTAFAASNVMGHKATLSWTSDGSAWQLAYTDDATIEPDNLTPIAVTTNSYQLTGLAAETPYYAYVRTDCGGTYSAWTSTTFTTPVACPVPTGLACTAVTATTATLSWTEAGEATNWVVEYGTATDFTGATSVNVSTTPSVEITGLTAETVYYARVKADCGDDEVSTWSATVSFEPTAKLVIGSGTASISSLPTNTLYDYSYTQQIYTVEELGEAGLFESIDFYMTGSDYTRALDIYMVSTDKNAFEDNTDWIAVTDADKVFSGEVEFAGAAWTTIALDNAFIYNGTQNVAIIVDDNTGEWSGRSFLTFTANANQSHFAYQDATNIDPSAPTASNNNITTAKNQIRILKSEVPSCFKPTSLSAGSPGSRRVELSWNSDATAWQICINGDETNLIDVTQNPYVLDGLTPATEYTVKVRANCGEDGYSDWAEITFTTDVACPAPADLAASDITPFAAKISWATGNDNFEMHYREMTDPNNDFESGSLKNWKNIDADGDGYGWVTGMNTEGVYYSFNLSESSTGNGHNSDVMAVSGSYSNVYGALTPDNWLVSPQINLGGSISFWACAQDAEYYLEHFGVYVSTTNNTDPAAFTMVQEWTFEPLSKGNGTKVNPNTTRSGSRLQTTWRQYTVDLSAFSGQGYVAIRHFDCTDMFLLLIDDIVIDQPNYVEPEWITVANATNPYTLTGLNPETAYEVEVRNNCGDEDGYSTWAYTCFATLSNCEAPTNLIATPMPTSATLEWEGMHDSYNLRYRPAGAAFDWDSFEQVGEDQTVTGDWTPYSFDLSAYEGQQGHIAIRHYNITDMFYLDLDDITYGGTTYNFDDGNLPEGWRLVDKDGDGYNWQLANLYDEDTEVSTAYSGNYAILSASYVNNVGAVTPDNWIILPYGNLGGTLTLYAKGQDPSWAAEVFGVFVTTEEIVDEQEWTDVLAIAGTSNEIGHLSPNTNYEWQVQGINPSCTGGVTAWSTLDQFHTPDYCDEPTDLEAIDVTATSATLTWTGYQDSYNVKYRPGEDFLNLSYFWNFGYGHEGWTTENLETCAGDNCYASGYDLFNGYFTFVYTTNTPQYLISPEVEVLYPNSTLRLYYLAYQGDQYPETFEVGFSTTDNDINSFVWGETVTATNTVQDAFLPYDIAIPDDAKYFAVKCTSNNQFFLILNNFIIYETYVAPGEWVNVEGVTETSLPISDLTPDTFYEWYVQGVDCDGEGTNTEWVDDYFYTEELTNVTQTTALSTGTNWFSSYVEITLDDLKAALVAALPSARSIVIKSNEIGQTSWNGRMWIGTLTNNNFDLSQMYMITVPSDCEITLENTPIDPAAHPVTISNGANWIGFPFSTSMSVTDAFAGFALRNDVIKSNNNGQAMFNGRMWIGDLKNLEPGQGYIYNSTVTGTTTFTYSTTSKAFKQATGKMELKALEQSISLQKKGSQPNYSNMKKIVIKK